MERCAEVLRTGIAQVTAGIDRREVAVFAGLAGGMSGSNAVQLQSTLSALGFGFSACGSDVENVLELCLRGRDGIAVIAGTGCVAFAQKNGERYRVGGWGYLIDSGGSGYHIGRDALEAAFRCLDGRGVETELVSMFENAYQKPLAEAVPSICRGGKKEIASLAPLVFEAYSRGDAVAMEIVRKNVFAVAELIERAAACIDVKDPPVYLCGGLANRADVIRPILESEFTKPYALYFSDEPIVFGAVACARRKYEEYRTEK